MYRGCSLVDLRETRVGSSSDSAAQMDNGLDTYESDLEQEETMEQGGLENALKPSMPSGSLAPSVDASEPASSAEAVTHAPSSAGVLHVRMCQEQDIQTYL